jgi:hypothetical protein
LLERIEPSRDQILGEWSKQGGTLISPLKRPALLEVPVVPPESYILTAVVERLEGQEAFSVGLVVGDTGVTAVIDGFGGNISGLQQVGGRLANMNPTRFEGAVLKPGPNKINYQVTPGSVIVQCNEQTVVQWSGDPQELSFGFEWRQGRTDRLRIGTWASRYRISALTLAPK